MGMLEGGPDLIFRRGRDDVAVPWKHLIVGAIVAVWGLFIVVPYAFAEDPSSTMLIRWTAIALIGVVLALGLPALIARELRGATVGLGIAAMAAIVLAWVATA